MTHSCVLPPAQRVARCPPRRYTCPWGQAPREDTLSHVSHMSLLHRPLQVKLTAARGPLISSNKQTKGQTKVQQPRRCVCSTHVATHTLARGPAARTPARAWAGPGRPPGVRRGLTLPRAPAGETTDLTTLLPHRFSCAVQFWTTEPQRRGGEETPVPLYVIGPPVCSWGSESIPLSPRRQGSPATLQPQPGATGRQHRPEQQGPAVPLPSPVLPGPPGAEQPPGRAATRGPPRSDLGTDPKPH